MKRWQQGLTALFLGAGALLVGTITFTYLIGLHAVKANRAIGTQRAVLQELEEVASALKDAETGQRGYLITGEDSFLEPYQTALDELKNHFATLRGFGESGALNSADVGRLEEVARQRLAALEQGIQTRRSQGPTAAAAFIRGREGKRLMDTFRVLQKAMVKAEGQELDAALGTANWSVVRRTLAFAGTGVVNLLFLAWTYRRIIRERRHREAVTLEIARQKELMTTTLTSIGDAVLVTDERGRITFANAEAERLTGWKHEQALGQPLPAVFRIINEATRQPVENPVEKALRLGKVVGLANHTILIAKDGRETPIDDSAAPIREADGPLFGVVLVFRDFSGHKESERAIHESEERFRASYEYAAVGLEQVALDGRLLRVNDALCRMLGYSREELLQRTFAEITDPHDLETERPLVQQLLDGKIPSYQMEKRYVRKEGSHVWVRVTSSVARIAHPYRITMIEDITQRKEAETALEAARIELARANAELEETVRQRTARLSEMVAELQHVSYAITHDMRAPLRAMNAFATVLIEESAAGISQTKIQEYCSRILVGANRLDKLITDALSYTKAVLLELPMQPVNLSTLIRGMLDTYPNFHPDKAYIEIEGELPAVMGNESLLTQCFSNLLSNAVKFVAPGVRPQVRIRASVSDGFARLSVMDNGVGIPPSAQRRLFGMFQKLDNIYEGTGIGLAIVRKVVERMGGKVGAESELGKGSCFWVELRTAEHRA